jgi:hypothetical protein
VQLAYILIYLLLAFFVMRWSRGVLPLIAALAIGLGIFAAIAVPGWYARDHPGFIDPGLASDLLGLVCALVAIVQLLLIFFAMSGFRQAWNVEVEKSRDGERDAPARRGGPRNRRRDQHADERQRREDERDTRVREPEEQPTAEQPRREPGTGSTGPSPAPA